MKILCRRALTLLGSRAGCKVTLKHKGVAPVHAAIVVNGEKVHAVDLVTLSGTFLNGLKMEHELLNDGDLLTVGPWEFRVDIQQPSRISSADANPFGLEPSPQVIALEHLSSGRILQPTRDVCIIGRRNGCDIAISDPSVSRTHAMFLRYYGHPVIFDLLTKRHTFVNDEPVGFRVLQNDDVVSIGESRFRVRLAGSPVGESASKNQKGVLPSQPPISEVAPGDLVDIETTEKSQRWRIADSVKKVAGNT
jgi:pSer/pThr/pTyr-binding forkhead associated (FHA) protein